MSNQISQRPPACVAQALHCALASLRFCAGFFLGFVYAGQSAEIRNRKWFSRKKRGIAVPGFSIDPKANTVCSVSVSCVNRMDVVGCYGKKITQISKLMKICESFKGKKI